MDYRTIFPTHKSQYDQLWNTDPDFRDLSMKVYRYLDHLPPGRQLSFAKYSGAKLKYIIYTCWAFYWEQPHPQHWTFAPDFSAFRHHTDTRPDKNR